MRSRIGPFIAIVLSLVSGLPVARADIDAEQVRRAIQRGIDYLKREQHKDGSWSDQPGLPGGISGLCTLALLTAGEPMTDPSMRAAVNHMRKIRVKMTYSLSLQTMVLANAEPLKDLLLIRDNVQLLEEIQLKTGEKKGAWGYSDVQGAGDNSNSQFALLALNQAERAGVTVKDETWRRVLGYWQRTQNFDGSWGYMEGLNGTGSMTCAGISAMVIASERLNRGDAEIDGDRVRCCGEPAEEDSVDRGLAWLGQHFSVHNNPGDRGGQIYLLYYLYGLERVGRLTNQRFIGRHDWYREGAEFLVNSQEELAGFWKGVGHAEDNPHISTSLALLFLAKGRRPVLVSKLKHEPRDDWNHHRTDLANLTGYVEKRWGRELTWQVIDINQASADDLNQTPVLFLSGQQKPNFTPEQIKLLREYIDRGGFLFAESCCDDKGFDAGFRQLMEQVFPEPEHKLHLLPPEHPIWGAEERIDPDQMPPLWGIDAGCRTSVAYCPQNLGCYWELARPDRPPKFPAAVQAKVTAARSVGVNVLAYATNRELKFKLEIPQLTDDGKPRTQFERAKLYVEKLRHNGGWNVAPGALMNLLKTVSREAGLRISTDQQAVALTDPRIFDYHLLFMHGRNAFHFSDAERKQLRTYVLERGGMLFADAICSSEEFTASFRHEMELTFPDLKLKPIPATDPLFSTQFGGFDLHQVSRRELRPRAEGGTSAVAVESEPELEGIKVGSGYSVIFSHYDLSCALERHDSLECPGYTREDAARIGLNVVLYSLQQ
jgi:hypothetical protein